MEAPELTPAERHYQALRKAQKAYYDRKHPKEGRRPVGRPRKVVPENMAPTPSLASEA
jgi:hypothetical protein